MDVSPAAQVLRSFHANPGSVSPAKAIAAALQVLGVQVGSSMEGGGGLAPDSAAFGGKAAMAATRSVAQLLVTQGSAEGSEAETAFRTFQAVRALSSLRLPEQSQLALQTLAGLQTIIGEPELFHGPPRDDGIPLDPRIVEGITRYLCSWVEGLQPTLHDLAGYLRGSMRGIMRLEAIEYIRQHHFRDWTTLKPFDTLLLVLTLEAAANGKWDHQNLVLPPPAEKPNAIEQFNTRPLVSSEQKTRARYLAATFGPAYPEACKNNFGVIELSVGKRLGTARDHLNKQWAAVSQ